MLLALKHTCMSEQNMAYYKGLRFSVEGARLFRLIDNRDTSKVLKCKKNQSKKANQRRNQSAAIVTHIKGRPKLGVFLIN